MPAVVVEWVGATVGVKLGFAPRVTDPPAPPGTNRSGHARPQDVDAVRPPRDLGRTPLFQAVLTFATDPSAELCLGATQIESQPVLQDAARTDLTVEIHDTTPALDGVVEFSTDLFDRVTVASFTDRLLEELAQWNR